MGGADGLGERNILQRWRAEYCREKRGQLLRVHRVRSDVQRQWHHHPEVSRWLRWYRRGPAASEQLTQNGSQKKEKKRWDKGTRPRNAGLRGGTGRSHFEMRRWKCELRASPISHFTFPILQCADPLRGSRSPSQKQIIDRTSIVHSNYSANFILRSLMNKPFSPQHSLLHPRYSASPSAAEARDQSSYEILVVDRPTDSGVGAAYIQPLHP
jgi:hypothetical protein